MKVKHFIISIFICTSTCIAQVSSKIAVSDAKADLNELVTTIKSVHYNAFHKISAPELQQKKDSIFQTWKSDSISFKVFTRVGMQLTAMMSNGHTSFDWQNQNLFPELLSSTFLPVNIKLVHNELVVDKSFCSALKEGEVIETINNQKATILFSKVMTLTGGIPSFKKIVAEKFFSFYLFFFLQEKDEYQIKTKSGNTKNISGIPINTVLSNIQSEINSDKYTFKLIEQNIGLLSYNKCEDYEGFKSFLDSTFQYIATQKIDKLIIDLRANSGGNSSLNDLLLSYITQKKYRQSSGRYWKVSPEVKHKIKNDSLWNTFLEEAFLSKYLTSKNGEKINKLDYSLTKNKRPLHFYKGKHCFLIGAYTFSSANYLADAIKTFSLSTLIGKSTGELTNDYGEQVEFQLSNSKFYFFVPTTYDIGANKNVDLMSPVDPDIFAENDALEKAILYLTTKR